MATSSRENCLLDRITNFGVNYFQIRVNEFGSVFEMPPSPSPKRRGRPKGSQTFGWRSFFEQSTTPVFILGSNRRLRYANGTWEKLCGVKLTDVQDLVCSSRRHSSALAQALMPTPEALAGKVDRIRRSAPFTRPGYQWWDITFTPLRGEVGLYGILGTIEVVNSEPTTMSRKLHPSIMTLRHAHAARYAFDLFQGCSPQILQFLTQLRHAAATDVPIWFWGEPGSGKETAARVVHHNGPRREKAFIGVDCVGLQPYLIDSLLFGHGGILEGQHVGTLYLKNPMALPRDLQAKVVEAFSKTQNVRLISSATRSAADEVSTGHLLQDFHIDLAVLELQVPALRHRLDDLPRLAAHWLPDQTIEPSVFEVLRYQPWPGNLRELRQILITAHQQAGSGPIRSEHLPHEYRVQAERVPPAPQRPTLQLDKILESIEKEMIRKALRQSKGKLARAAELLGIWQSRLLRRMKALDINLTSLSGSEKEDGSL